MKVIEHSANPRLYNYIAKVQLEDVDREVPNTSINIDLNLLKHLIIMIEKSDKSAKRVRFAIINDGLLMVQTRSQYDAGNREVFALAPTVNQDGSKTEAPPESQHSDFPKVKTSELNILCGLNTNYRMKKPELVVPQREIFYVEPEPQGE